MTTTSPFFTRPAFAAAFAADSNNSSAVSSFSISNGSTPQLRLNCLQTLGFTLHPIIVQFGLFLEIIVAVLPDIETVIIADAFKSIAVVQVAWEMAVVISGLSIATIFFNRFL